MATAKRTHTHNIMPSKRRKMSAAGAAGKGKGMHLFHRKVSKDDLRNQVAQVTMEIQQLKHKADDLRKAFDQLDSTYAEAQACCFPCAYIVLRDMVEDADDLANRLHNQWYGATESNPANSRRGGSVSRLVANCQTLAVRLTEFNVILGELSTMSYKELERALSQRQALLTEQKVVFGQLQDLLQQLQTLHTESQRTWFIPRYLMLKRGANSVFSAFTSVAGLSTSSVERSGSTRSLIGRGKDSVR